MPLRIVQQGSGSSRPLLLVYHLNARNDDALRQASPSNALIVNDTTVGSSYADTAPLDQTIQTLKQMTGASSFSPIIIAGFSAGGFATRRILEQGGDPDALVIADGTYATAPEGWAAWQAYAERAKRKERAFVTSNTSLLVPSSTWHVLSAIAGVTLPLGNVAGRPSDALMISGAGPAHYQDGNFVIYSYPTNDMPGHQYQGDIVLPAMLREAFSRISGGRSAALAFAAVAGAFVLGSFAYWMHARRSQFAYASENPVAGSTFIISAPGEAVTVSTTASMLEVAQRLSKDGPITIREVFPDGGGRWIVPPPDCVPEPAAPPSPVAPPPEEPWWQQQERRREQERREEDAWRATHGGWSRPQIVPPRTRRRERRVCPMPSSLIIGGIDVVAEMKRLMKIPILHGMPIPNIYARNRSAKPRKLGHAEFARHMIMIVNYPGVDRIDVLETLSHELAHLRTGRETRPYHGRPWKENFQKVAYQGYGVRFEVPNRFHGEMSRVMRGGRRSVAEGMPCCADLDRNI